MSGKLDELEVIYIVEEGGIRLHMQIDKRSRGLLGMLSEKWDIDERNVSVFLPNMYLNTPAQVANRLADIIENEYAKIR